MVFLKSIYLRSLISLSNISIKTLILGTSNADVLDKLKETQVIIDHKLLSSQQDVSNAIIEAKQNVSGNLRYVKNLVQDTSSLLGIYQSIYLLINLFHFHIIY
jgi:hypothetical protein